MKINRFFVSGVICLFFVLTPFLAFTTAFAATIRVPSEQATIQAGIDAASDGDTVLVADGTYTGEGNRDIDFKGKAITVQSENGAANCIIDFENGAVRGFSFRNGETQSSILSGFTITRTNIVFGAISCESSSPTIRDCTISENDWHGIDLETSSPTILNCTIKNNGWYGINCDLSSSPIISGCTITGSATAGIRIDDSSPIISNCIISGNNSPGITCYGSSSLPTISGCSITGNKGRGITCASSSSPKIIECTISENTNSGIYCHSTSPTIEKCIIRDNMTTDSGGGVRLYNCVSPKFTNCLIIGNTSFRYGGALYSYSSAPIITNCTISGNTASSYGGLYFSSGLPVIKNTITYSNSPDTSRIGSGATVNYSDTAGYSGAGTGNIDENPLFLGSGDYRLLAGSPCIFTGTSNGAPDTDIDGTPRPQGSGYDMGAYEYVPPAVPAVTTTAVSSVSTNSALGGGNVTSDGGASITVRGVCWSTSANPTINESHTTDGSGTGSFTSNLTGLNPESSYHVRAYATNSVGTAYGNDVGFTTCPDCSGSAVTLTDISFPPNVACECIGTVSITIGAGVTIPKDATVIFKAPRTNVEPGFHAEFGSVVSMKQP